MSTIKVSSLSNFQIYNFYITAHNFFLLLNVFSFWPVITHFAHHPTITLRLANTNLFYVPMSSVLFLFLF